MNKKIRDRLSFKDNTKTLFLFFENINILNYLKKKSGPYPVSLPASDLK